MTHTCSVPGCGRVIPSRLLMCAPHWRLVPLALQQRVYEAFDEYQEGTIRLPGLKRVQAEATAAVLQRIANQPSLPGMDGDAA